MKTLIIIPTYNERENIGALIPRILEQTDEVDVLVVDDNSPDGTGKIAAEISEKEPRVFLLQRPGKRGFGSAYCDGFRYALENGYDAVMEMDADFSHDPKEIPNFLKAAEDADLVQGSRYLNGVNVINWPLYRLLLSYFANLYTRIITGLNTKDSTGGFRLIRREALKSVDLRGIKSNGYSFQIELLYKIWLKGFKVVEIPIIFVDRVKGKSKMSKRIIYEAMFMVWKLRLQRLLGMLK
ncbi:polyprenol monophosphomannose synthase [bacterium]|nr:polyprenol monophosphomannose synthase [bacterium]